MPGVRDVSPSRGRAMIHTITLVALGLQDCVCFACDMARRLRRNELGLARVEDGHAALAQDNGSAELVELARAGDRAGFEALASCLMPPDDIEACWSGCRRRLGLLTTVDSGRLAWRPGFRAAAWATAAFLVLALIARAGIIPILGGLVLVLGVLVGRALEREGREYGARIRRGNERDLRGHHHH